MTRHTVQLCCLLLTIAVGNSACVFIDYTDFPREALVDPPSERYDATLYYHVVSFEDPWFGGYRGLKRAFAEKFPLRAKIQGSPPGDGIYVDVFTSHIDFSGAAYGFAYLSAMTLFVLPSWSAEDGYVVTYQLYLDGEVRQRISYDVRRIGAMWIGLLPLAWANLFTRTEAQAFEATALQFFKDVDPEIRDHLRQQRINVD